MRRHRRFETIASAYRNEFSCFFSEQFGDGAGIAPADGHAGQDQRAGVDLVALDFGLFVLRVDKCFEGINIDPGVILVRG